MNFNTQKNISSFVPSPDVSSLVNEQMLHDSFYHPNLGGVTRGGMSNHFPMTVMALSGLGASDNEIEQFGLRGQRYRAHLESDLTLVDTNEITLDNWTNYLGQANKLLEFSRVFEQGILQKGVATFVAECLEKMMLSLPMGLFHPLIKLNFAIIHGDTKLIANALAYFAIRYYNLYKQYPQFDLTNDSASSALSVWQEVNQSVGAIEQNFQTFGGSLRVCEQFCSEESLQQLSLSNQFSINQDNLTAKIVEISQAAIRLYLHHPALTTLHAVTSCQALADLTNRLGENKQQKEIFVKLWTLYWVWLTGLYVEKGSPENLPMPDDQLIEDDAELFRESTWQVIAEQARKIPEAHLIKMVYSCKWMFDNVEKNQLFKLAAINILVEKKAHPTYLRWTKLEKLV
ncbi:MAG: hypothetical protein COA86_02380 [Kangiella sp.]|nr:MAG: hypothetical protein COA86_02380 [Kangiella sp.]